MATVSRRNELKVRDAYQMDAPKAIFEICWWTHRWPIALSWTKWLGNMSMKQFRGANTNVNCEKRKRKKIKIAIESTEKTIDDFYYSVDYSVVLVWLPYAASVRSPCNHSTWTFFDVVFLFFSSFLFFIAIRFVDRQAVQNAEILHFYFFALDCIENRR